MELTVGSTVIPNQKVPDISVSLDALMEEHARDPFIHSPAYFIWKVRPHGDWDLKYTEEFNSAKYTNGFVYHGEKIRRDDPGNIHYGYVGDRALWTTKGMLLVAGGVVQIGTQRSSWSFWNTNFDDPHDQWGINYGIYLNRNR